MIKIMTKKIMTAISDIRTLWIVMLSLITAIAYAGDLRWMTYSKHNDIEVKEIRRTISMLEVDRTYAKSQDEKSKAELKIKIAENQIKEIKGE